MPTNQLHAVAEFQPDLARQMPVESSGPFEVTNDLFVGQVGPIERNAPLLIT